MLRSQEDITCAVAAGFFLFSYTQRLFRKEARGQRARPILHPRGFSGGGVSFENMSVQWYNPIQIVLLHFLLLLFLP